MLVTWWEKHNHPIISYESLSPLGLLAVENGEYVAVSFAYVMHGCDLAQIAWTTTNPEAAPKLKYQAINECISGLLDIVKLNQRKHVICFSSSRGLTRMIEKHGLKTGAAHTLLSGCFVKE